MIDADLRREIEYEVLMILDIHFQETKTPFPFSSLSTYVLDLLPIRDSDRTSSLRQVNTSQLMTIVVSLAERKRLVISPTGMLPLPHATPLSHNLDWCRQRVIEEYARYAVEQLVLLAEHYGVRF